jgi:hypothetical protein
MRQEPEIVIGVMEDDLDLRVGENLPDQREICYGERIDNCGLPAGRDLEQIDPITKAMKACRLRVQRDERLRF